MPPTAKRIEEVLEVSTEVAERVRGLMDGSIDPETSEAVQEWLRRCYNRPRACELIMKAIDEALETHGVEAMHGRWRDPYFGDITAVYCNMGDPYIPTVFFYSRSQTFTLRAVAE